MNVTFENLPAKITFFCTECVNGSGVKVDPFGQPVQCIDCSGNRIIASHQTILKLTPDYCIPSERMGISEIEQDIYYVLLVSQYIDQLVDFNDMVDTVRSARYIKDRFFFTNPLPEDVVIDTTYFTHIAWIPKR